MSLPDAMLVEELSRDEIIRSLSLSAAAQIMHGAAATKKLDGTAPSDREIARMMKRVCEDCERYILEGEWR